jgi:trehalose 6-phosphate synthase/phosphatase
MPRTILNVSNRLPITIGETIKKSSGGLVAALEGVSQDEYALKWIGWPGGEIPAEKQPEIERTLKQEYGAVPVFITREEAEGFYEGVSNSSIWPLLHYLPSYFRYEPHWWDAYRAVNERFAQQVLANAQGDELVWVHDYQLMLVPALLREAMPSLRVGFFLHTPFPSYEIFRYHPKRTELMAGLLGADLIGFHTFGYMRHFRSCVLRLLGYDSEITRIRHAGHETTLGIYPIGINAPKFEQELRSPEFREHFQAAAHANRGKQIVLSVERMDYTKGILHRLDAIDLFLAQHEDRDGIRFIFVSVPSREGVADYQELRAEVESRIGRLNGKYATVHNSPIHFIHGSVDFTDLCALYALADVGLITPLRDGMNLVAKEYVACQRDRPGALILSEFAGAAEELFNAYIVNPYDAKSVADAIGEALRVPPDERRARMEPMRQRVMRFDAQYWARSFIADLAAKPQKRSHAKIEEARGRLARALRERQRVAMFLDYDGTLREIERDPAAARPHGGIRELLDRLHHHPNIDVTIISGRTAHDLESFLGSYDFGFIAEHGASVRRPGRKEWENLDRNISYAWKHELSRVLQLYTDSTPGSFTEDKRTSLVWHYRKADPEFGAWKAGLLAGDLSVLTANEPLQIRHGRKIVEITSTYISKGGAVMRLLDETKYDLVLIAGDDQTDESMFRLDLSNVITIHVGDSLSDTVALYQLPTPSHFRRFLLDAVSSTALIAR